MTDARTTFHDVLAEIAVFGRADDVERTVRWTVEYLTRRDVFYQFGGQCRSRLVSANGQRFDGSTGTLTVLPGNLAVPAMADFAYNAVVAFTRERTVPSRRSRGKPSTVPSRRRKSCWSRSFPRTRTSSRG
jgi:hypothetical protein